MDYAIQINDVSFAYGDLLVLDSICLEVAQNEFLGVVGPNAGGKSTLIKIILGPAAAGPGKCPGACYYAGQGA